MAEVFSLADSKKKYELIQSVELETEIGEIFKFHLDTNNLPEISPSFPKASVKSISDVPLKQDSTVTVTLNFILFKTDWEILIEKVIENELIVDLQKKGLFEYWSHSHIFESKNGKVIMTDKVEFIPPFGFLGRLSLPFIRLQLTQMFNYRHKKTKQIFEN